MRASSPCPAAPHASLTFITSPNCCRLQSWDSHRCAGAIPALLRACNRHLHKETRGVDLDLGIRATACRLQRSSLGQRSATLRPLRVPHRSRCRLGMQHMPGICTKPGSVDCQWPTVEPHNAGCRLFRSLPPSPFPRCTRRGPHLDIRHSYKLAWCCYPSENRQDHGALTSQAAYRSRQRVQQGKAAASMV